MTSSSTESGSEATSSTRPDEQGDHTGKRDVALKAEAAGLLAHMKVGEVAVAVGVTRSTIWRWMTSDPEFQALHQKIVDGIVAANVRALRGLSTDAIEALRQGVNATEPFVVEHEGEKHELLGPDRRLAVRSADLVLKRIPEFAPRLDVMLSGSLEARLAALDESDDPGSSD